MCANSLNLWTLSTLIMFAAKVYGVGPELSWITVLTPWMLGELLYQSASAVIWGVARKMYKERLATEAAMRRTIIAKFGDKRD